MKRSPLTKKVLVLGVDGMDPRISKKFLDEGKMLTYKNSLIADQLAKIYICSEQFPPLHRRVGQP